MNHKSTAIGVILGITALVVLIPILLQMRSEGRKFRDVWGHFVFVAGLLCVAAGYGLFDGTTQKYMAFGGLAAALIGLFIQHRDTDSETSDDVSNTDV